MKHSQLFRKALLAPLFFLFIAASCKKDKANQPSYPVSDADLRALPKDMGGTQTPVLLNNTNNTLYGYYVYTPSGYQSNQQDYPLLVFLHGGGEIGNSLATPTDLKRVLNYGPPSMINGKTWSPKYPLIVVSPQCTQSFKPDVLNEFIKSIIAKYRINTHRIYLTGLSLGGGGTFKYLLTYSTNGYVAAAVPMASAGASENPVDYAVLKNIPIWAFCGEADDKNFPKLTATIRTINNYSTALKTKLTAFPGVGHNCWSIAYSGSGMGAEDKTYDSFNTSIYDWMFKYAK